MSAMTSGDGLAAAHSLYRLEREREDIKVYRNARGKPNIERV
jgi:hypothetical protein